jgi:TolB-like protein/Tfp pilus assembly protein PilF/tRNA A-37 threonylcarbamoyl transferase component Bud32
MIGETVTHYRILDRIGEGGMGVVYRAEDTRLGRQVAVKFLSAKLSQDPLALERFQREARAASSLSHPHICALYDVGRHGDLPFLVMELLDGTTLRRRLAAGPLPMETVLDFGVQIADALDAAHALRLIHRDIKSANIFVTERGQIKMLDFGLAKLAHPRGVSVDPYSDTVLASPSTTTDDGQTLGTLSYMSPEQARGQDLDPRSDLFSFGVVLYEMATGKEPFAGRTSALVFDAILHGSSAPPSASDPHIPAEFDHIIAKALEKDRDLRYQTAAELRADLKRLQRESGGSKVSSQSPRTAVPPTAPVPVRKPFGLVAGIVAALVVLTAAGYFWFRGSGTAIDSVAVLPFVAAGQASDAEYLTDGMTETLINGLAQLPDLRVAARSVAFRYKGKDVDPQQVGRDLGVRAIVTGRITRRNDRLIIGAEMMNVDTGAQVWGRQYDRPESDLLAVQEEITGEILDKLRPRMTGNEKKLATKRYTEDSEAYQHYLQGRYNSNKGTIAGFKNAIEYFQRAIQQDPKYALAYAGLADAYLLLGSYWVEAITEAKSAAEQALKLDPSLAEAHVSLGQIKLWLDWDWSAARREFEQGISLNPQSALAHNQYGLYLATVGRVSDAITEVKRALDLDALSPIINSDMGWYLLFAGQHADAIAQFRKTLNLDSNSVSAHRGLGIALSEAGQHDEAISELKHALLLSENSPVVMAHLGAAYARQGAKPAATALLNDLQAMATRQYVPASAPAIVHAALGDRNAALDWLDKAYDEHDFAIVQIEIAPWFRILRGEDRFQQIVTRLGMPR